MNMTYGCMCIGTAHDPDCFVNKWNKPVPTFIAPTPMEKGWKCPECDRSYAPWFRGPCNHTDRIAITVEATDET